MARPKGFKLSEEQKAKMQAGRKKAKAEKTEEVKKVDVEIIGYAIDKGENEKPYPVFASEKKDYKGKIFATAALALESNKKK
jgi:hypothetical protein